MNRREFIRVCGAVLASTAFGHRPAFAKWIDTTTHGQMPRGMAVIDAHAPAVIPVHSKLVRRGLYTGENRAARDECKLLFRRGGHQQRKNHTR